MANKSDGLRQQAARFRACARDHRNSAAADGNVAASLQHLCQATEYEAMAQHFDSFAATAERLKPPAT